jgi:diguanylate cyclase (GGDEF)-like protein
MPSLPVPLDPSALAALGPLVPALLRRDRDALVLKDAGSGAWLYADELFVSWLGRMGDAAVGRADSDFFSPDAVASLRAADQAALAADGPTESEHRLDFGAVRREVSVLRQCVTASDGRRFLALVWRDLAAQRRRDAQLRTALEQLEQQQRDNDQLRREVLDNRSLRDLATGLYSRAHFEDQLRREVDLSTREHREFALVSIEIDPLAAETGADAEVAMRRVFEAMGRLLRSNTRAMDASCRYEEERFAVLLSGVGLATAHSRMEGLRRQCATQIVAHEGRDIGFTVSMGVASFPHTAHSQDELRAASEAALAEARSRGGNRVTLASIRFDAS